MKSTCWAHDWGCQGATWCHCTIVIKHLGDLCPHHEGREGGCEKLRGKQLHLGSRGNPRARPPKATSKHMEDQNVTGEPIREAPRARLAWQIWLLSMAQTTTEVQQTLLTFSSAKLPSLPLTGASCREILVTWFGYTVCNMEYWSLARSKTQLEAARSRALRREFGQCAPELLFNLHSSDSDSITNQARAPNATFQTL